MHAKMVIDVINREKCFCRKPLALNYDELNKIIDLYDSSNVNVSVGFNRRFSPLAIQIKKP